MLQRKKISFGTENKFLKTDSGKGGRTRNMQTPFGDILQAYNLRNNFQLSNIYYMPTKCLGLCQAPRLER